MRLEADVFNLKYKGQQKNGEKNFRNRSGSFRNRIWQIWEALCTEQKYICVSRPGRVGKSMAANTNAF